MSLKKKPQEKTRLHHRNKNRERYDLKALLIAIPKLSDYVKPNKHGDDSVDFSNPIAVKLLNKGLLNHYYGIKNWDFPDENLCPPVPGRADYIHYVADLLGEHNFGRIPLGDAVLCYDIGLGASCIYPIIGVTEYNWKFIGSDISEKSIASAQRIIDENKSLEGKIDCLLQKNQKDIFYGIIRKDDKIDISICNPPFHSSAKEALKAAQRKVENLSKKKVTEPQLNFSGMSNELVYEGGEINFIFNMIRESSKFSKNCYWFTTLVSKQSNLKAIEKELNNFKANEVKIIPMGTGNKSTRIVAWTFLSSIEQKEWRTLRWKKQKEEN